jgi:hypothetical protein
VRLRESGRWWGITLTLIATAISQYGIVQAADPRLTSYPHHIAAGQRIFRLGFLNAILSVTGRYAVAGEPLDRWMAAAIDDYERTTSRPSLSAFVEQLRERLTRQRDPISRRAIHIAGYVGSGRHAHAELYYLRNIRGRAPDGSYGRPGREFIVSEEFWSQDYSREETRDTLREGGARMYLDGYPEKRIGYMLLHKRIHDFYQQLWRSGSKTFRSPRSLEDIASLVELDMRVAATFLIAGDYGWRRTEHSLEVEVIPAPGNTISIS